MKLNYIVPCNIQGIELVEDIKKFTEKKHRTLELMRRMGTKTDDPQKIFELMLAVSAYDEEVRGHVESIAHITKQKEETKDLVKKAEMAKELETMTLNVMMISILKIENMKIESATDNKELITLVTEFLKITNQFDLNTVFKKPTLNYYTQVLCEIIAERENMIIDELSLKFMASMKN
jgi:hypothetical protein